jgi:hypothetical protein
MQIKHRSCFKCKYEIETTEPKCARCGRRLRTRTEIRVLGAVMISLGGFLLVAMSIISGWIYTVIFHPESANGAKFTGDENQLMMIAGVFGFIFLFSFVAIAAGLWQLILGRRNMILVWTILGLGIIFIVGGNAVIFFN